MHRGKIVKKKKGPIKRDMMPLPEKKPGPDPNADLAPPEAEPKVTDLAPPAAEPTVPIQRMKKPREMKTKRQKRVPEGFVVW